MRLRQNMPALDGATTWLNHHRMKKEDLMGRPTLFHFWSVSCDQCKTELPQINRLQDIYGDRLNIVAVHMPRTNDDLPVGKVEKAAKTYDITQPIYVDHDHILTEQFSVNYVPAYFLFDEEGKLRHLQEGGRGTAVLFQRIDRMVRLNN